MTELETLKTQLKTVIYREADGHHRHGAIVDALEAKIERLREAAAAVVARWDTPKWADVEPTSAAIERLRDVLTKQEYEHMTPTVLVHYDAEGEQSFKISGDVTLIIVDERSPHDRAYHYREQTPIAEILAIVGDEIGSSDDQQHLALAHKIERAANGRPALSLVPTREQDA